MHLRALRTTSPPHDHRQTSKRGEKNQTNAGALEPHFWRHCSESGTPTGSRGGSGAARDAALRELFEDSCRHGQIENEISSGEVIGRTVQPAVQRDSTSDAELVHKPRRDCPTSAPHLQPGLSVATS